MFKIIIYSIIIIGLLHFVLYYFNVDLNNILKSVTGRAVLNIDTNTHNVIDSINELKILNECINNGQIDTSFS